MFSNKSLTNSGISIISEFKSFQINSKNELYICALSELDEFKAMKTYVFSSPLDLANLILQEGNKVSDVYIVIPPFFSDNFLPVQLRRLEKLGAVVLKNNFGQPTYDFMASENKYNFFNYGGYERFKEGAVEKDYFTLIEYDQKLEAYVVDQEGLKNILI